MTRDEILAAVKSGANLSGADLRDAYLSGANLSGANLRDADLRDAYLSGAYLSGANLRSAYLSGANLSGAYLSGANLSGAYLSGANLSGANLSGADLSGADLSGADLSGANLRSANLSGADLSGADLRSADLSGAKLPGFQIPQEGTLIVWKKLADGVLCKLRIPAKAKRTASLIGRKCRAEYTVVISGKGVSQHDGVTRYAPGLTVMADKYDPDIRVECSGGIHFFLSREEAEGY